MLRFHSALFRIQWYVIHMKPINYALDKCQWILNNTNYFMEIEILSYKRIFCVFSIHEIGVLRNGKMHNSLFFHRNPLLLKLQLKFTFESWSNVGQKWLVLYCTKYMWLQILLYYSRNNSFIHDFRWNAHIRFIYLVNSFSYVVCYLPKR